MPTLTPGQRVTVLPHEGQPAAQSGAVVSVAWPEAVTVQVESGQVTVPAEKVVAAEAFEALAAKVAKVSSALYDLLDTWYKLELPGDVYTPETGYPFHLSLDEMAAEVSTWHDAVSGDADVAAGRA